MTKKINPNITKSEALSLAWKHRRDYKGYDKSKGSKFNTWRAIVYGKKARKIGFPEAWKDFATFDREVCAAWQRGFVLCRKDCHLPYSNDNVEWREKGAENMGKLARLEYNGENKTLLEWCEQYNINYNGVRQRYFRGKGYTAEQILFGKNKRCANVIMDINDYTEEQRQKDKVSRMLSQYRLADKKKGLSFDIDKQWLFDNIKNGQCHYCGDTKRLGLDRIDNSKGHTKDNVVLCCYECNIARGNNFTYEEMLILGKTIKMIKSARHENK